MDIARDPRYQEAIQRIMAMSPEQRAVLSSASVDKRFGSEAMRRRIAGMKAEATRRAREQDIGLRRGMLGLEERKFKAYKSELPSLKRLGYAEVGVAGLTGLGGLMMQRSQAQNLELERAALQRDIEAAKRRRLAGIGG